MDATSCPHPKRMCDEKDCAREFLLTYHTTSPLSHTPNMCKNPGQSKAQTPQVGT